MKQRLAALGCYLFCACSGGGGDGLELALADTTGMDQSARALAFTSAMNDIRMGMDEAFLCAYAGNWEATREHLDVVQVGLADARTYRPFYDGRSLSPDFDAYLQGPLDKLQKLAAVNDWTGFREAFEAAVEGCNRCHVSTNNAFNVIVMPVFPG